MSFFDSESLGRRVNDLALDTLSQEELTSFSNELHTAIKTITIEIDRMNTFWEKHGYERDVAWIDSAKKKRKIATLFAMKLDALGTKPPRSFEEAYIDALHLILAKEFDANDLEEIRAEAKAAAQREFV